jgi:hypothetical protein
MRAASSADSLADHHQDRHLMMPVATISLVTVDRLYRWLMAGEDGASPQRPSAALRQPRSPCTHHGYGTYPARYLPVAACLPPPQPRRCVLAAPHLPAKSP